MEMRGSSSLGLALAEQSSWAGSDIFLMATCEVLHLPKPQKTTNLSPSSHYQSFILLLSQSQNLPGIEYIHILFCVPAYRNALQPRAKTPTPTFLHFRQTYEYILINFLISSDPKPPYIFSMRKDQQLKIRTYLQNPSKHPRPMQDEHLHFVYLLTYLGEMFIQGYRIIQHFGDVIILSLMEFQISEHLASSEQRSKKKLPARYVALLWQYDESSISQSASQRKSVFSKLLQVSQFFPEIQYNIIYLHTAKYSIMSRGDIEKIALPTCKNYYKKIQWIEQRNGLKPLQEKDEGIELHKLAEIFIKGAGEARDLQIIKKMQSKNKFYYDLFNVIHTICYVVGKEMLENDYQTISSQKWMRFTTEKRFKRYDLLLRNEVKSGIIDWKFSKLVAEEKIKGNGVKNKNKQYYQLAYKDFLTDVELKFYCFHARVNFNTYHFFTCASYFHKIPIEYVGDKDDVISIDGEDQSIEIQNDLLELVENQPGEDYNQEENSVEIYSNQAAMKKAEEGQPQLEEGNKGNEVSVINIDDDESKSTDKENKEMQEVDQVEEIREPEVARKRQRKVDIKAAKFQEKFIDLT